MALMHIFRLLQPTEFHGSPLLPRGTALTSEICIQAAAGWKQLTRNTGAKAGAARVGATYITAGQAAANGVSRVHSSSCEILVHFDAQSILLRLIFTPNEFHKYWRLSCIRAKLWLHNAWHRYWARQHVRDGGETNSKLGTRKGRNAQPTEPAAPDTNWLIAFVIRKWQIRTSRTAQNSACKQKQQSAAIA